MLSTWIESSARGRQGGPVRAGMWSTVVVGTHPVESGQEVWLDVDVDEQPFGLLPAYWLQNKGANSFWHVPIPPQAVGSRIRYRSGARHAGDAIVNSPHQEVVVRPNLPLPQRGGPASATVEGLVGNQMMTVRVDARGSTDDIFFPTTGLHSDVRPASGDLSDSPSHFRTIMGGLAIGPRLEWFDERLSWEVFQRYQGATNVLVTSLRWRHGPIRVQQTDFAATGPDLPKTATGNESPGQYLKRFRVINEGSEPRRALFGIFVHAEVNGGVGEPGLSWHDEDKALLATNRGHWHANRKLARDATVEFALALDDRGQAECETAGPNEAMILRWLDLPAGGAVDVELLISGGFTGWSGDQGTFEHWLRPALAWFRSRPAEQIEQEAAGHWDRFVEPLPTLQFPRPVYAVTLRRSALGAALHADAKWGAIVRGYDVGLHAYCWPRDAIFTGGALDRVGHPEVGRGVLEWLDRVRSPHPPFTYWSQKYTTDGWPEWETPAVDQSAMIPWALERHYRRTGDLELVESCWPMIEQAAAVCSGASGHPGLRFLDELSLISSDGIWGNRYGAFLASNVAVVAGLGAACRLAELLDHRESVSTWCSLAERIWEQGILAESAEGETGPGMVDRKTGRFLDARRLSKRRGIWTDRPEQWIERSSAFDISVLSASVPFGLLPASDPRVARSAEAILAKNAILGDPNALACWTAEPGTPESRLSPSEAHQHDPSSLATLWMARYLIRAGRETGESRPWTRVVELLNDVIARLGPLGLSLNVLTRRGAAPDPARLAPGVWALHAMLIETLLDLAGLDYDVPDHRLSLSPVLPADWPSIGLQRLLPCGSVGYELRHAASGRYSLQLRARLDHPVVLRADLTCPGLTDPGSLAGTTPGFAPRFDRVRKQLTWTATLPEGDSDHEWSWG